MRWQLTVLLLVACGDGEHGENLRCSEGPSVGYDAINAFLADSPGCTSDDECVVLNTSLECVGLSMGSCGNVVHRDAIERWDPRAVCAQIERLPADDGLACDVSPSCVSPRPACVAGRCTSR